MRFDWQQDSKEHYFRMAEERIEAAGVSDFLHIDRSQFSVIADRQVKVYMQPVQRKGNMRRWWQVKKEISEFTEQKTPRNQFGKREASIFLKGYFLMEMEANENESEICKAQ